MATSLVDTYGRISYPAGVTGLTQYTFVALNGSGQLVPPATNGLAVGILDDAPPLTAGTLNTETGEYSNGYTVGLYYGVVFRGAQKVYAGGTLAAGAPVATNAYGQAIPAVGTCAYVVGQAMYSCNSGDLVMVSVSGTPALGAPAGMSRIITAPTTITSSDSIILVDADGGAFTQPLPSSFVGALTIGALTGNTNLVTLTPAGGDTIEGNSSLTLGSQTPYQAVQLALVGTNWVIL